MSSPILHLNDLRNRWETARRRGITLSAEQLCHDCPELLAQVRQQLPHWETEPSLGGGSWDLFVDASATPPAPLPETFVEKPKSIQPIVVWQAGIELVPGHRLTRPIGKGAYGEVWHAGGP